MFINLTNIDFCPGSGGGSANLQEDKSVTYTSNGSYTINPDEGYDGLSSVGVEVSVSPNLQSKTSNITANGNYTISPDEGYDGLSSVGVTVNYDGTDYRNQNGTVDVDGLRAIGWDETSIGYFNVNAPHYPWENDNYKVTDGNKALYGVVNKDNVSSYSSNPDFIYCPYFDTAGVTNMNSIFEYCSSLQNIPLLDTSNVTSMGGMFYHCKVLKNIPRLNTSKVTTMSSMFAGCNSLQSLPLLDTSNVTSMNSMFNACESLQTIPKLDTSKVTTMSSMFAGCTSLQSLPLLDTSNVTNMNSVFNGCTSLPSIPQLDTSKAVEMDGMFSNCSSLPSIPQLDTSKVTTMSNMFYSCSKIQSIPKLDTSKVWGMHNMFSFCSSLQTISLTNTSNVTNIDGMFYGCSSLQTISGELDFSNITNYTYWMSIFGSCENLTHIRLKGSLNINLSFDSYHLEEDYDSVKSILTAASNTTNTNSKTLSFRPIMVTDQKGELANLVATCTTKGWTIDNLTLN